MTIARNAYVYRTFMSSVPRDQNFIARPLHGSGIPAASRVLAWRIVKKYRSRFRMSRRVFCRYKWKKTLFRERFFYQTHQLNFCFCLFSQLHHDSSLIILNSDHNSIVSTNQMNVPRGDTYITGHITIVRHGNLVNTGYSNHNATSCLSFLTDPNSFFNLRPFQTFPTITNLKFSNN